uniref:Uncharacterized protein n=1 Tax=Pyrodinium bahamense TaxID=73915 RepID=A0A7S0AC77_9DINO
MPVQARRAQEVTRMAGAPTLRAMLPGAATAATGGRGGLGGGFGGVSSTRRRSSMPPGPQPEEQEAMTRSLRLGNDERFVAMSLYAAKAKDGGDGDGQYARMIRTNRRLIGLNEDEAQLGDGSSFQDVASWSLEASSAVGGRLHRPPGANIKERIDWQESFDHSVRRLLVDFQLSDAPSCRLQHLERMHAWFEEHGKKQTRKAREGPNYLVADRGGSMPAGSTKDIPSKYGAAHELLPGAFKKR